jgi:ferritin-like metal-binding protein YciE
MAAPSWRGRLPAEPQAGVRGAPAGNRQQVARLERAGQQIGAPMQGAPCEAMQGLAAEAERLIAQHQRGPLLDVVPAAFARAIEHHEIAAYGTMRTLARSSGMGAVADLLEQRCGRRRPPTRS